MSFDKLRWAVMYRFHFNSLWLLSLWHTGLNLVASPLLDVWASVRGVAGFRVGYKSPDSRLRTICASASRWTSWFCRRCAANYGLSLSRLSQINSVWLQSSSSTPKQSVWILMHKRWWGWNFIEFLKTRFHHFIIIIVIKNVSVWRLPETTVGYSFHNNYYTNSAFTY